MEATNWKARSFFCRNKQSKDKELVSKSVLRLMDRRTGSICHLQDQQTLCPSHAIALIPVQLLTSSASSRASIGLRARSRVQVLRDESVAVMATGQERRTEGDTRVRRSVPAVSARSARRGSSSSSGSTPESPAHAPHTPLSLFPHHKHD